MNKDDIMRMAREAVESDNLMDKEICWLFNVTRLERFFHAAYAAGAAHEREACARLCDGFEMAGHALWDRTADPDAQGRATAAADCAAAIRARGGRDE